MIPLRYLNTVKSRQHSLCNIAGILKTACLLSFILLSFTLPVWADNLLPLNQKGKIMILEYHKIAYPEARWTRTPENFRKDLQRFYEKGYSLIRLEDFLKKRIKVEKGRTPLILTFDDSSPGQLRFIPDGKGSYRVDPDCAVGILESFNKVHTDFGLAATFFVLPAADPPNRLFNQPEYTKEKLRYLAGKGFEIGNHTYWHATLSKLNSEGVKRQLALAVKVIQEAVPGYSVVALSLPMGIYPQDKDLLLNGSYEGTVYRHLGVLMVAGGPAKPAFDPLRIPRIQATESELNYWIKYFDKHPEERFIGD